MAEPFLGEVRMFGFNYSPREWAFCNGNTIALGQNPALYSLLGTAFGGNGTTTFQLPDIRGRTPVHRDAATQPMGEAGGVESVLLTVTEMPSHTHTLQAFSAEGNRHTAGGEADRVFASSNTGNVYVSTTPLAKMNSATCSYVGQSQGHYNMQPSLAINFCIALQGVYPSRN